MKDIRNYGLLAHNTFGIDAKCSRFLEYESVEEARQIVGLLTEADRPLLILGGGSNLLLTGDYAGTVLHSAIMGIEVLDNKTLAAAEGDDALCNPDWVFLSCGSGEVFDDVVAYAVEHGYHGAENLSIIPGEVGASAVQNIGAYGVEAKDIIYKVEAVEIATGRVVVFDNADCEYSYRQSKFKHEWKDKYLVTHVIYRLQKTFRPDLDYGNMKGKSLGRAGVHDKQALVLVNRGGATGEEIVKLCKTIQEDVKQKFGIEIHPEVNVK